MSEVLNHSSARVLEFESLRELLRGYASSPLGQSRIASIAPSVDAAWIGEQQELTEEVREFRRAGGRFDFSGLLDVAILVQEARIAGRVSMDQTMVDVTGIPGVAIGDEVVLLGSQGAHSIDAWDLADLTGTIPWEVLCAISARVPRLLVD